MLGFDKSTSFSMHPVCSVLLNVVLRLHDLKYDLHGAITGNPGSVIVPQYGSSKIKVFVWGKNIILKFLGNTK